MKHCRFALAALAIFAGTMIAGGCTGSAQPAPSLAPLGGAADWIGTRPSSASLAGKVVILDVFTVDCYNCRNVVPQLRALYERERGRGLAIVGIHAPETPAERNHAYVASSLRDQGIVWPVAIDNGLRLWNAYGVSAWPTQLFFDRHGRFRGTIVGDSQDERVRELTERLLAE
jgi:thiol-disulfide isomerase/thioredoxin